MVIRCASRFLRNQVWVKGCAQRIVATVCDGSWVCAVTRISHRRHHSRTIADCWRWQVEGIQCIEARRRGVAEWTLTEVGITICAGVIQSILREISSRN